VLPLSGLSQLAVCLVARLRELLERERVQPVDDLLEAHCALILHDRRPQMGLGFAGTSVRPASMLAVRCRRR